MSTQVKTHPGAELDPASSATRGSAGRDLLVLVLLAVALSAARWCTLESFWGDSPRWIFEAYRGATGELVYRDFAWQYPPLPMLLFGGVLRVLGPTFWAAQLLLDLISAAVVLLTWDLARRILPKPLPLLIAAAMACAGASNTSNFALFSLQIYTPAILVGMVGLLILLREIFDYVEGGRWSGRMLLWVGLGSAICLLSKPEYILGCAGALAALAIADLRVWFLDRPFAAWLMAYVKLALVCVLPSVLVYAAVAALCGPANVLAGVGGYGLAALSCPWWPTGLGLFGALVALGYGVIAAALISLTRLGTFRAHYGNRYMLLWALAAVAALLAIAYLPFCAELPMFAGRITVPHTLTYFLSTGTMLIPSMWWSIVLCGVLAVRLWQSFRSSDGRRFNQAFLFIILSAAVLMSVRGLFNGTMTQLSLASVAAYPIWFIIGPLFLVKVIESADHGSNPRTLKPLLAPLSVVAVVSVFLALRLVGVLVGEVRRPYARVATEAGTVRFKDTSVSPKVYAYISAHTSPHEPILDLATGGGINLADRRPSPIFSTQFSALAPPKRYLELDDKLIRQHPPRIVLATDAPNYDATYGICMNTGCTFPSFVWRSKRPACDSSVSFPILDYVRKHYHPLASFGDKIIYVRSDD